MSGIFTGIQAILNTILGPIKYLIGIIELAVQAMKYIAAALANIFSIVNYLPNFIKVIALTTIAIAVVYQLMGRSQGYK